MKNYEEAREISAENNFGTTLRMTKKKSSRWPIAS